MPKTKPVDVELYEDMYGGLFLRRAGEDVLYTGIEDYLPAFEGAAARTFASDARQLSREPWGDSWGSVVEGAAARDLLDASTRVGTYKPGRDTCSYPGRPMSEVVRGYCFQG